MRSSIHPAFRAALLVGVAALSAPAFAASQKCSVNPRLLIVYANGMFTNKDDADANKIVIEQRLRERRQNTGTSWLDSINPKPSEVAFGLAYNYNEGAMAQLLQVFRQRTTSAFRSLVLSDLGLPQELRDLQKQKALAININNAKADPDLRAHVQYYRNQVLQGNKVTVIAHSQGNMYTNEAWDLLFNGASPLPPYSWNMVSVATPDNHVGGNGPYTTLDEDMIMNTVRAFYPGTLPGNCPRSSGDKTIIHHGITEAYLSGEISREKVLTQVVDQASALIDPPATASGGIITATLEWDQNRTSGTPATDLDLHVFEPSKTGTGEVHLTYNNPTDGAGSIDLDNRDGSGPEHYFLRCSDLVNSAVYKFAINYYSGSGTVEARLQIQAGTENRTYRIALPSPQGYDGNNTPKAVVNVFVLLENGEPKFTLFDQK
jgi:hypothetical protein